MAGVILYLVLIGVTFVISLWKRRWHAPEVQRLSFLLGYMLAKETFAFSLYLRSAPHGFLTYFYQPVEYLFICQLYAAQFHERHAVRVLWLSAFLYSLYAIVLGVWAWREGVLSEEPTALLITEWVLIITLLLYYFYTLYRSKEMLEVTRQPVFWISIGNFLFYCGTFFLMGLYAEIQKFDPLLAKNLFFINTFLNLLLYTFWSIGFLCLRKPHRIFT